LLVYGLKRALAAIPLALGVATILFFVLHLAPGDPASAYFGGRPPPEVLEAIRHRLGLDQPLLVQYGRWLLSLFRGDFGLLLAGSALLLAFVTGIVLGVTQAVRQHSMLDHLLGGMSVFFYALPSFWLALMLILFFNVMASAWGWPIVFPASGSVSINSDLMGPLEQLWDRILHMALPVLSLTLVLAAGIARYVRGSMLEVLNQDYIRTGRAKGLPESRLLYKHALRNALIPVVTLFGLYFPFLLGGTVFVEHVFALPGMGKLVVDAIGTRDYPVVLAGSFLFAGMVVVGNLLADLLYALVDPRIRHGRD